MPSVQKVLWLVLLFNGLAILVFFNMSMHSNSVAQVKLDTTKGLLAKSETPPTPTPVPKVSKPTKLEADELQEKLDQLHELIQETEKKLAAYKKLEKQKKLVLANMKAKAQKENLFQPLADPSSEIQQFTRDTNPFMLLGAYPEVKIEMAHTNQFEKGNYNKVHYGIDNDPDYCEKVDYYNLAHPENVFAKRHFWTDYSQFALARVVIGKIGKNLMPQIDKFTSPSLKTKTHKLDIKLNSFFSGSDGFHVFHEIGKNFLCATQMYNRVPGARALIRKDDLVESIDKYAKKYSSKPECFNKQMFFPLSYRLVKEEECKDFFKLINSKKYINSLKDEPIQYLIKVGHGSHSANGVFILDQNKTKEIKIQYDNGKRCGIDKDPLLAQKYVANPLLLNFGNKFDFRIYMLIASVNPLIVYYHDGFLRASLTKYDKHSQERGTHLTNTHLAEELFNKAKKEKVNGMNEKELRDYHVWSFAELEEYLLESGKTSDPDWLENVLRPQFRKAMVHAVKMSSEFFWKQSNVYGLFGLDFMLDDNFNLWFIEGNPNPQLAKTNEHVGNLIRTMLLDLHEIEFGLYKSRMTRIFDVIKRMQKEQEKGGVVNYKKWQAEYKKAASNRFEPMYKPRKANSFVLVMDESLPASEAYQGNLEPECVNPNWM